MILQLDPSMENIFQRELSDEELRTLKKLAASFNTIKLRELLRGFMGSQYLIRRAVIPTLPIELVILETLAARPATKQ